MAWQLHPSEGLIDTYILFIFTCYFFKSKNSHSAEKLNNSSPTGIISSQKHRGSQHDISKKLKNGAVDMLTLSQFAKRRQSEPVLNFQNIGLSRSTDFTAEKEKPTVVLSSTQRLGDPKGLPPRPTRINRAILPPLRPT